VRFFAIEKLNGGPEAPPLAAGRLTLLARLEVQNPKLPGVLMSADHDALIAAAARAWPFVPKPVAFDSLLRVVEAVSVDRKAA
jgi:hypothetical protein